MTIALTGARIFDGTHMLEGRAVVIENGRIRAVPAEKDLGAGIERRAVEGLLAPGFIDVQVNGGGGVLFNDVRSVDGIRTIAQAHRAFGTTGLLPTLITDTRETHGGSGRSHARRRSLPAFRAFSASISKAPSSTPSARACTIPPSCARWRMRTSPS